MTLEMNAVSKLLMLEFNELTPRLMNRFMSEGILPNFQRLHDCSRVHLTTTSEERLEPWIQWVTVHSGVTADQHGIFRLNEGSTLDRPMIWDAVSNSGANVWLCGPMNVNDCEGIRGVVLPDPWSTIVRPQPIDLMPLHNFITKQVQEHTMSTSSLRTHEIFEFLWFIVRHGLRATTVVRILIQLLQEKTRKEDQKWKRATILDSMLWDVFEYIFGKTEPQYSCFFSNSTAHYQHKYWRHFEPEKFSFHADATQQTNYGDAIRFGYRNMDRIVGRALDLADNDTIIVLCTALSQQPLLKYEEIGGKKVWRPKSFRNLLDFAGVSGSYRVSPVMAEQSFVYFETDEAAAFAKSKIDSITSGGETVMSCKQSGESLFVTCRLIGDIPMDALVTCVSSNQEYEFSELFCSVGTPNSGMHHPEGIFWIRFPDGEHKIVDKPLPLTEIAPLLAKCLGVDFDPASSLSAGVPR